MNHWLLDVLTETERILGEPLSSVVDLTTTSEATIEHLCSHWEAAGNQCTPKAFAGDEPAAFLQMFNTRDMSAWLSHTFAGGTNHYRSLPSVARDLRKYLLYYGAVVVKEPLGVAICEARAWADTLHLNTQEFHQRLATTVLQNGLRFWAQMRPLVRAGLVLPYPSQAIYCYIHSIACDALCALDDENHGLLETAEREVWDRLRHSLPPRFPRLDVTAIAKGANNLNRRFFNVTLLFAHDHAWELVPQSIFDLCLVRFKTLQALSMTAPSELSIREGMLLGACQLPITDVSDDDLIALHGSQDSFCRWRRDLRRALADAVATESHEVAQSRLRSDLVALASDLREELSKYRLKRRIKDAGIAMGAGFITGACLPTSDVRTTLATAGLSGASRLLLSILIDQPSKVDGALARTYTSMAETSSGVPALL